MTDIDAVIARVRDIAQGDGAMVAAHIDAQADKIADLRKRLGRAKGNHNKFRDELINFRENLRKQHKADIADLRDRVEALTAALTDIMQGIANYGVPPRETQERARAALAGKE